MEADKPIVRVAQGELRGIRTESLHDGHYFAFRGVPYAKPPVADLRFKDPEPLEPWDGVRDAFSFGDICAQVAFPAKNIEGSDDCLYLNVYANSLETGRKLPVMVFIHGGGFQMGSGNEDLYGPDYLLRKDIVLVTINYRVGALGFLNVDTEEAPGNQGLKDQVMALKWVQENIAVFGGNPENVTIFGESAGSSSVHYLLLSPLAQGLYHKAIMQSGTATTPWASAGPETIRFAYQLSAVLGNKTHEPKEIVDFLRTIEAKELVKAQEHVLSVEEIVKLCVSFTPSIDSKAAHPFMPQSVQTLALNGIHVPLMVGYNENEGAFFAEKANAKFMQKVNENFENIIDENIIELIKKEGISISKMRKLYFGDGPITTENTRQYANFLSDIMFVRNIHQLVDIQMEKAKTPTYMYKFCFEPELSPLKHIMNVTIEGATHADELRYVFCHHLYKTMGLPLPKAGSNHYKMMESMVEMWTDFARTGNPTPVKTDVTPVIWQPIGKANTYDYLKIDEKFEMEKVERDVQRFNWTALKNKL